MLNTYHETIIDPDSEWYDENDQIEEFEIFDFDHQI